MHLYEQIMSHVAVMWTREVRCELLCAGVSSVSLALTTGLSLLLFLLMIDKI